MIRCTTKRSVAGLCLSVLLAGAGAATARGAGQFTTARSYRVTQSRSADLLPWDRAERSREALERAPEPERTRARTTRVLDNYRAIYHGHPADLHAAEAVNAVAELLAEAGRREHDAGLLRAAVKQYEYLRTQYPGSSLRVGALLCEAQIEQNDLDDRDAARDDYLTFLAAYPRSALVERARAGLALLDAGSSATAYAARGATAADSSTRTANLGQPASAAPVGAESSAASSSRAASAMLAEDAPAPIVRAAAHPTGKLAVVTGIRHWSTPNYTRVAIDLGDEVEYQAARVPSPDRIYFDLHGARLAPELVGKSFAVTDDGFLKRIRVAQSGGDFARIVLDVNDVTEYSAFLLPNPYRLIIDIHGRSKPAGPELAMIDAPARPAVTVPNTRAVNAGSSTDVARLSEQPGKVEATRAPTSQPISAVVTGMSTAPPTPSVRSAAPADGALPPGGAPAMSGAEDKSVPGRRAAKGRVTAADARVVGDPASPARTATKTADGQTSLVRALGLKINRIVIDAGHGGHDSGTIGVGGLEEKDVVLDVALRLGKLLHDRLGAEVIYTRSDDTFIPLETRTAIANKAQADLFLSIHANSSPDASARGVESYYLNFTAQPDALEVAARENAVSGQSIHELSDLVKKITLKDKIAESREFAMDVEQSLYGGLARGNGGLKDRGVKKAPFVVLIGANMPSILAEISFVTNPRDAGQLRQPEYRERVAESLFRGVSRYSSGLSGAGPLPVERASRQ